MYFTIKPIIMKTTGNNIPFTGAEYDWCTNEASYYKDGRRHATLIFDTNVFEVTDWADGVCEEDLDYYYDKMVNEKNKYK